MNRLAFIYGLTALEVSSVENKKMKETESSWLAQHPEIRLKYRGEYIAVSGERVLAHGKILNEVMDQARKTDPDPLLCKVPDQDILVG